MKKTKPVPIIIPDENVYRSEIRKQPDGMGIVVKHKVKKTKYTPHQGSKERERRRR